MTHITVFKNQELQKTELLKPLAETLVPLSPELGTMERQIVHANRCFPMATQCDKEEFLSALNALITKAYVDMGYNIKDGGIDIATITFTVANDIYAEFKSLTIPEIQIAFHKGTRGEYSEVKGLSSVAFYGFLKSYFWETRTQATIKQRKFEEEQEMKAKEWKPTPEEQKIIKYFAVNRAVEEIMNKDGFSLDSAGYTYGVLLDLKLIEADVSKEYQSELYKKAKENLIDYYNTQIKEARGSVSKENLRKERVAIELAEKSEKGNKAIITKARDMHAEKGLKAFCKGKNKKNVMLEVRERLIGKISNDELIWEAWRLKLRKPNELFKNQKEHKAFLDRTKELREKKPMRP